MLQKKIYYHVFVLITFYISYYIEVQISKVFLRKKREPTFSIKKAAQKWTASKQSKIFFIASTTSTL